MNIIFVQQKPVWLLTFPTQATSFPNSTYEAINQFRTTRSVNALT